MINFLRQPTAPGFQKIVGATRGVGEEANVEPIVPTQVFFFYHHWGLVNDFLAPPVIFYEVF